MTRNKTKSCVVAPKSLNHNESYSLASSSSSTAIGSVIKGQKKQFGGKTKDQVVKRNARERNRVRNINTKYCELASQLSTWDELKDQKLTKSETLKAAILYIQHLQQLIQPPAENSPPPKKAAIRPKMAATSADLRRQTTQFFCRESINSFDNQIAPLQQQQQQIPLHGRKNASLSFQQHHHKWVSASAVEQNEFLPNFTPQTHHHQHHINYVNNPVYNNNSSTISMSSNPSAAATQLNSNQQQHFGHVRERCFDSHQLDCFDIKPRRSF